MKPITIRRGFSIAAALCVLAPPAAAQLPQFSIDPVWSSTSANRSRQVVLGDVDADGDLDAVFVNEDEPTALYVNDGGALRTSPILLTSDTLRTQSVALGDVDGDGDLDRAAAH